MTNVAWDMLLDLCPPPSAHHVALSSTLRPPLSLDPSFIRKLVKSSLGGEVYAFTGMLDHMSMLRELYGRFLDPYPGMVDLEDSESLSTNLKHARAIEGKFLVRRPLAKQQAIEL